MIARLRGIVAEKAVDGVIVDVQGVGYHAATPLTTLAELPDVGQEAELHIHTYVREDAIQLFGFSSKLQRELFKLLIGVSGIGPRLALTLLSGMETDELKTAVAGRDTKRLTRIPGIGKRTAERLVVELSSKFEGLFTSPAPLDAQDRLEDVVSALVNLGYKEGPARAAVEDLSRDEPFEELLKSALKRIMRR